MSIGIKDSLLPFLFLGMFNFLKWSFLFSANVLQFTLAFLTSKTTLVN